MGVPFTFLYDNVTRLWCALGWFVTGPRAYEEYHIPYAALVDRMYIFCLFLVSSNGDVPLFLSLYFVRNIIFIGFDM